MALEEIDADACHLEQSLFVGAGSWNLRIMSVAESFTGTDRGRVTDHCNRPRYGTLRSPHNDR